MYKAIKIPNQRKHTLAFLEIAKNHQSVYLHSEIRLDSISANIQTNKSYGYLSYLMYAISRVLAKHPRANSYYKEGIMDQIVEYNAAHAKFTMDQKLGNERIVISGIIAEAEKLNIVEIQTAINNFKQLDINNSDNFKGIKFIHRLPLWLGQKLIAFILRNPKKAVEIQGTFSISSLGKNQLSAFFPITTTTLGFGVGRVQSKNILVEGKIETGFYLPLTMCFDHRVIDGAFAADILDEIKIKLENFSDGDLYV